MKKITLFLLGLVTIVQVSAQSLTTKSLTIGGGISPVLDIGYPVQVYDVNVTVPDNFEATMHKYNAPVDVGGIKQNLSYDINGVLVDRLTKESKSFASTTNADVVVNYDIKDIVVLDKTTVLKAPAYIVGIEASLNVKDKNGQLLYSRNIKPTVNTYVINPESSFEYLTNRIIFSTFDKLYSDFYYMYNYLPFTEITPYYFDYNSKKAKKLDAPAETLDLFNQSTQVFNVLFEQKREQWPQIFEPAQNYWKGMLTYNDDKNKDFSKEMRFAATYDLFLSYYLLGDFEQAQQLLPALKENDVKSFFTGGYKDAESLMQLVDKTKQNISSVSLTADSFERIQPEADMTLYELSPNIYEALSFEGSTTMKDGEVFNGKIKIMNDNPALIDWRTVQTGSTLGNLLKATDVEKNSVYIEVPNAKKPVKKKIDDIATFTTKDGSTYYVDKVGEVSKALLSIADELSTEIRYAILKEKKQGNKLSIYEEVFPYNGRVFLKKSNESEFYELPSLFSLKKSLLNYFESCPQMVELINQNNFNQRNEATYQKLFDTYNEVCK